MTAFAAGIFQHTFCLRVTCCITLAQELPVSGLSLQDLLQGEQQQAGRFSFGSSILRQSAALRYLTVF